MNKWYIEFKEHAPYHIEKIAINSFRLTIGLRRTSFICLSFHPRLIAEEIHRHSIVLTTVICAQNTHATVKFGFKLCKKILKLVRRSILVCRCKTSSVVGLVA